MIFLFSFLFIVGLPPGEIGFDHTPAPSSFLECSPRNVCRCQFFVDSCPHTCPGLRYQADDGEGCLLPGCPCGMYLTLEELITNWIKG